MQTRPLTSPLPFITCIPLATVAACQSMRILHSRREFHIHSIHRAEIKISIVESRRRWRCQRRSRPERRTNEESKGSKKGALSMTFLSNEKSFAYLFRSLNSLDETRPTNELSKKGVYTFGCWVGGLTHFRFAVSLQHRAFQLFQLTPDTSMTLTLN